MKRLILPVVAGLTLGGCVPLVVLGVAATAGSGYMKYKGMHTEAEALDAIKEEIRDEIREAKDEAEDR